MAHTTCQGIDTCSDPGDPPLVRCLRYAVDGGRFCQSHQTQAARQIALRSVLKPGWWKQLKGSVQPPRRRDPQRYKTDARDVETTAPVAAAAVKPKKVNPLAAGIPTVEAARQLLTGKSSV
jgi:hypothetical protein